MSVFRQIGITVGAVISGGSIDAKYQVTADIVSANGDQVSLSFVLPVADR